MRIRTTARFETEDEAMAFYKSLPETAAPVFEPESVIAQAGVRYWTWVAPRGTAGSI